MAQVDIDTLERALSLILEHIRKDLGQSQIQIAPENAMNWVVARDVANRLDQSPGPNDLGLSDVSEDMEMLQAMVEDAQDSRDASVLMAAKAARVLDYLAATLKG